MTKNGSADDPSATTKPVRLERTFPASIERLWERWTTQAGIESWWGPPGFSVSVREIDVRVGGALVYVMTAVGPAQIEFMQKSGMPLRTESRITFVEVEPPRRLVYTHRVDFIPGVAPYDVSTRLELAPAGGGARLVLTLDPMHAEEWTQRAVMGWEMELGQLAEALATVARA